MDPKLRQSIRHYLTIAGWVVGSFVFLAFLWIIYADLKLFTYSPYDGARFIWSSENLKFANKAAAVMVGVFETFGLIFLAIPIILTHIFKTGPFITEALLFLPFMISIVWSHLDDSTSAGAPRVIPKLDLELLNLKPIFGRKEFSLRRDFCFYLGPFNQPITSIYQTSVAAPLRDLGFNIRRADEIFGSQPVMNDIWDAINEAYIIVADVTGRNPNVMYEIGMAHTVGKKVIILTQTMDDVPFDLRHIRCIVYEDSPVGLAELRRVITVTIQYEAGLVTTRDLAARDV